MADSSRKRSRSLLAGLVLCLSLVLVLSAQAFSGCCGGKGSGGACKYMAGGKTCGMSSEGTSSTDEQKLTPDSAQVLGLDAFAKVKLYTCPMHPEVRQKKSGNCPKCGMKLEQEDFYEVYVCPKKECPKISAKAGKCCGKSVQKKVMSKEEYYNLAQVQDEYFCPMHPEVISAQAGTCPKCGMDLEKRTVRKAEEESKGK
ncbi:MAG: heavy metal-binding domain-containing protein [Candidatus Zixiibacteriota bacterium]